ncbi:SpoIIIAH-like family protein [Oceanobacillus sp. AG]|uniref:Stage III sporulation protein AH n=2 Tax=Oceanobacillus indicireducens TaxID=1004261 RepID=A0A917Y3W5_9BACI|nr:SpoIIIAH-like family protein [Oceanobacillus sp. AG]GGN64044.1 stage III sporulation protein AH [Oceanobacillus indicireducens]
MLKKQTVWLLTMLSLLIVLSVYYIMSPNEGDLAFINQEDELKEDVAETDSTSEELAEAEVTDITNVAEDELFTTIRMKVQDDRSRERSRLESIVASGSASIEEKNNALEGIDEIETVEMKEEILEESILAEAGYEDVLVRNTAGEKVHVHVRADELSDEEALRIMQMVRDEFDRDIPVEVNY